MGGIRQAEVFDRVLVDIFRRSGQIEFVRNDPGPKPFLPERPAPVMEKIEVMRIPAEGPMHKDGDPVAFKLFEDQMDVRGHQAIGQDLDQAVLGGGDGFNNIFMAFALGG